MAVPLEMRTLTIWIEGDGIVRMKLKPNMKVNLQDVQASVQAASELSGGKRCPVLVDMRGLMSMDREARVFLAGEETAKVESAAGLVIASPLTRAIGNFFMGLNKPLIPTRLFTSEAEALAWLKGFVQ